MKLYPVKRSVLIIALLLIASQTFAQHTFETVDRKEIKSIVRKSSGKEYKKLTERFNQLDTTLTAGHYRLLYYGFAFQDAYSGYADHRKRDITDALNEKKYQEAISICDSVLIEIPISLSANYYKSVALSMLHKDRAFGRPYAIRYSGLLNAVLHSGDGRTCETAFKILYITDEYHILYSYFEAKDFKGQKLIDNCDLLSFGSSAYFEGDAMYFDASESLMQMEEMLKGSITVPK